MKNEELIKTADIFQTSVELIDKDHGELVALNILTAGSDRKKHSKQKQHTLIFN